MPNGREQELIRKLREHATSGELGGVSVTYRVTGGAPGEQLVDEELRVAGAGQARARMDSTGTDRRDSSQLLTPPELQTLLLAVSDGVSDLIPRSEARFIPDSIVGEVTVNVDGEEASFFFLPDVEQAKQHGKMLSPNAEQSVTALDRLHKRILQR